MRSPRFTAFAVVSLSACGPPAPPAHERVVIDYVLAIRASECDKAFSLLSATLQAAVRAEEDAQSEEERRGRISREPPRELYCSAGRYDRVNLQKTQTAWRKASAAEVHLMEAVPAGHLVPGFLPTRVDLNAIPMRVVLEGAVWKNEDLWLLDALKRRAAARQSELDAESKAREWNRSFGAGPPRPRKR